MRDPPGFSSQAFQAVSYYADLERGLFFCAGVLFLHQIVTQAFGVRDGCQVQLRVITTGGKGRNIDVAIQGASSSQVVVHVIA